MLYCVVILAIYASFSTFRKRLLLKATCSQWRAQMFGRAGAKIKRAPTVHRWGRGWVPLVCLRQVCPKCGLGAKSSPGRGLNFNGLSLKIYSVWTSTQYCSIKQVHFAFCGKVCHLLKFCVFGHLSVQRFCPSGHRGRDLGFGLPETEFLSKQTWHFLTWSAKGKTGETALFYFILFYFILFYYKVNSSDWLYVDSVASRGSFVFARWFCLLEMNGESMVVLGC